MRSPVKKASQYKRRVPIGLSGSNHGGDLLRGHDLLFGFTAYAVELRHSRRLDVEILGREVKSRPEHRHRAVAGIVADRTAQGINPAADFRRLQLRQLDLAEAGMCYDAIVDDWLADVAGGALIG
jgi:hypothetical protein